MFVYLFVCTNSIDSRSLASELAALEARQEQQLYREAEQEKEVVPQTGTKRRLTRSSPGNVNNLNPNLLQHGVARLC